MIDCDLSPDEISRIVDFVGYGSPSADIWFIGMEEGLGGMSSNDACMNLKARATFERTMDLREAHLRLLQGGVPIDIERNTPSTQVWRFMAKLTLAHLGESAWSNRHTAKEYVRFELGRTNDKGRTFLAELSPLPSRSTAGKELRRSFQKIDPNLESKLTARRLNLKGELQSRNPPLVICYGLKRADDFAGLLGVEWNPVSPKVQASSDRRRFLLPFFGQGQMSKTVIQDLLRSGLFGSVSRDL